jgi:hypothetical protein
MEFNPEIHQKVRYFNHLYVVFLDEFPDFLSAGRNYTVVLHPIWKNWIVRMTSEAVRREMTVTKGDCILEEHAVLQ